MNTIIKYVHDLVTQVLRLNHVVGQAFLDPKSEAAVVTGVVVSIATGVGQVTANGHVDWTAALGLISGFLARPRVSPAA